VINFEQTLLKEGAPDLSQYRQQGAAGGGRENSQERQTQRIRALRRALFANGDSSKRSENAFSSTRNGGGMVETGGCHSTSANPDEIKAASTLAASFISDDVGYWRLVTPFA
jgi:hypothetical protein